MVRLVGTEQFFPEGYGRGEYAERGGVAENFVIAALENVFACDIQDVRNNPDYMAQEIDILVSAGGPPVGVEIKHCDKIGVRPRNMVYEIRREYRSGVIRPGWSVFSRAEFLAWYSPQKSSIVLIAFDHYRQAHAIGGPYNDIPIWSSDRYLTFINLVPFHAWKPYATAYNEDGRRVYAGELARPIF